MTDLTFLSQVAQGFGALAELTPASGQLTVPASLSITAQPSGDVHVISKTLGLYRPCDVVGLERGAIYRTDPDHRTASTRFEPNYLAAVEFAAADLPWRFTPMHGGQGRRLPWLALIVLADGEFEQVHAGDSGRRTPRPPAIRVLDPGVVLPPSEQLGAWAHAQVMGHFEDSGPSELEEVNASDLTAIRSRLISARRLRPLTPYLACLVPAFECGRTRGLDPDGDHEHSTALSWSSSSPAVELPVYFSWSFITEARGDIETLAKRLIPRAVGSSTGTRPLNVGVQAYGVPATEESLTYAGAVVATERPQPRPQPEATTEALVRVLNTPASLANDGVDIVGLPALAPPIYGQWHARSTRSTRVTSEPHGSPSSTATLRTAAPLVSARKWSARDQEELVAEAWRQVGDVIRANRRLNAGQLGLLTTGSLYARSVASLSDGDILMISRPVHAKLRAAGVDTMATDLERSTLHGIATSARMRSAVAPRGASRRAFARPTVGVDPSRAVEVLATSTGVKTDFEAGIVDPALRLFVADVEVDEQTRPSADVARLATEVRSAIRPESSIPSRIGATLSGLQVATADALVQAVLPAPEFDTPMYGPLRDLSVEHLLPGIGDIPPNTVTLLRSNEAFIEAFMAGLNYEMATELLWRGYPATDLRATYFRHFWESAGDFTDIDPMHTWDRAFGEDGRPGTPLVLLIRGELIQRFPGILIYAQPAVFDEHAYELGGSVLEPIFRGDLTPDTVVVGFDLEESVARGFVPPSGATTAQRRVEAAQDPGFFFVLEEQSREARFGLDEPNGGSVAPHEWQAASWADVTPAAHAGSEPWHGPIDLAAATANPNLPQEPPWNSTAADTAVAVFQQPYRVAIHAQRLLPANIET